MTTTTTLFTIYDTVTGEIFETDNLQMFKQRYHEQAEVLGHEVEASKTITEVHTLKGYKNGVWGI